MSIFRTKLEAKFFSLSMMVLVDGHGNGDGYITPTFVNTIRFYFYQSEVSSLKIHTHYIDFSETDWSAQPSFP